MLRKHALAVIAAGSALVATPASAADILLDQWYNFVFGGVGSSLASGGELGTNPDAIYPGAGPWTFTLTGSGTLTLIDGFLSGDQFNVTNFGISIGDTSLPTEGAACGSNITACLATPEISQGVFALGPGAHSISGTTLLSPFGGGAGFFIVREGSVGQHGAVPEPGVWLMMLIGFGFVGASLRHRKATVRVRYA